MSEMSIEIAKIVVVKMTKKLRYMTSQIVKQIIHLPIITLMMGRSDSMLGSEN